MNVGKNAVCTSDGVRVVEDLRTHHRPARWGLRCTHLELRRCVSHNDFSQLTWRQALRDIEVCLAANQSKLFHMGLRGVPARSTLSDALARTHLSMIPEKMNTDVPQDNR